MMMLMMMITLNFPLCISQHRQGNTCADSVASPFHDEYIGAADGGVGATHGNAVHTIFKVSLRLKRRYTMS